jgi:hypothetical protein
MALWEMAATLELIRLFGPSLHRKATLYSPVLIVEKLAKVKQIVKQSFQHLY